MRDRVAQPLAGLGTVEGREDRADERAERVVLLAADMAAQIAQEITPRYGT